MPSCLCGAVAANVPCAVCGSAATTAPDLPNDISQLWRLRFDLIEQPGGPDLTHIQKLRLGQRWKIRFNLWAAVFGPFYYLAKGMWRQAVTYTVLSLMLVVFAAADDGLEQMEPVLRVINLALTVSMALRANVSYYKKIVQHDQGWL